MPEKKKDLKKKYAKEGYKTKVKTSRQGQEARMAKRGYIAVTSVGIGTARNESPTGPKPGELAKTNVLEVGVVCHRESIKSSYQSVCSFGVFPWIGAHEAVSIGVYHSIFLEVQNSILYRLLLFGTILI